MRGPDRRSVMTGAAGFVAGAVVPDADLRARSRIGGRHGHAAAVGGTGQAFFSPAQFAILDEFSEILIPRDTLSGGCRDAQVPHYLDFRIGESLDGDMRRQWRDALEAIDALSLARFKTGFAAATVEQRLQLVDEIARNEANPLKPAEQAFVFIKAAVAEAFFRSETGIRNALDYQGNVAQAEFQGTAVQEQD